ncbi:MAG: GIY-YIG nuclease family protein [Xanthobacteraceae bacterium]
MSSKSFSEGGSAYHVYLIENLAAGGRRNVGITSGPKQRLQQHCLGRLADTSKFKPWQL